MTSSPLEEVDNQVLLTGAAAVAGLVLGPALAAVAARLSPGPTGTRGSAPAPQLVGACNLPATAVPTRPADGPATARSPGVALPAAAGTSVVTGLLFAAAAQRFGADPMLPAFAYLAAVGVTLSLVDLRSHRLPNALTLPSYPIAAGLLGAAAVAGFQQRVAGPGAARRRRELPAAAGAAPGDPEWRRVRLVKLAGVLGM